MNNIIKPVGVEQHLKPAHEVYEMICNNDSQTATILIYTDRAAVFNLVLNQIKEFSNNQDIVDIKSCCDFLINKITQLKEQEIKFIFSDKQK